MSAAVTLAEAKAQCRIVNDTSEDDLINGYIAAAQAWVENFTGLALEEREITETFDRFASPLRLNYWPLAADADFTVSYVDSDGTATEIDDARLTIGNRAAHLAPAFSTSWPVPYCGRDVVTVTYTAGYASPDDVPQALKQAMLLLVGHWFLSREAVAIGPAPTELPLAVQSLCQPYRMPVI